MGKAEETKARVERAALTLFVARGVTETTTREIAMAASIAEGTIYRHFPSKEQLALDLFLRHHRALAEALAGAAQRAQGLRAQIDAIVRCYCEWADDDWTLFAYHLLTQHMFLAMVPEGTPNPVDVVREVIVQAMATGEIPSRDADLAAAAAIGTVMQPATYKLYGRFEGPLSTHANFFAEAAWAVLSVKET
ncbi:TetR/AcrR family transcriptional regulator [Reyranella sp.]|jgi:AcrR family transcriptional regulator|uniref:TetR/AcrR family transcriptional regulator n=1 Tax=Reyranella sp. TaxID=1929291 RepID=UPI001203E8D3|nr:TetR/AcrR family transcriptional regulator [Reyranella sp.]TAJ82930.1 MAG: TetR/AcrR family transcriptional regulator [Reyranella sp.]